MHFNPVADYVTEFTLPASFAADEVNVCFEGVESGFALWLNGIYIGYSEDSFTPADFALTDALVPGVNRLAVRVWKWTPGSWFEDQDFYRFSGIFRSVYLYRVPRTAVTDLSVVPTLGEDFSVGTVVVTAKCRGTAPARRRDGRRERGGDLRGDKAHALDRAARALERGGAESLFPAPYRDGREGRGDRRDRTGRRLPPL